MTDEELQSEIDAIETRIKALIGRYHELCVPFQTLSPTFDKKLLESMNAILKDLGSELDQRDELIHRENAV